MVAVAVVAVVAVVAAVAVVVVAVPAESTLDTQQQIVGVNIVGAGWLWMIVFAAYLLLVICCCSYKCY